MMHLNLGYTFVGLRSLGIVVLKRKGSGLRCFVDQEFGLSVVQGFRV